MVGSIEGHAIANMLIFSYAVCLPKSKKLQSVEGVEIIDGINACVLANAFRFEKSHLV
jgi:hypothetical protein